MRWLKYSIILVLPLLIIGLIGWQKGGVCDGAGGPIDEEWVAEARVDTVLNHYEYLVHYTAVVLMMSVGGEWYLGYKLDSEDDWLSFPFYVNNVGDSVVIDSIRFYIYAANIPAADTLIFHVIETDLATHSYANQIFLSDTIVHGGLNLWTYLVFDKELQMNKHQMLNRMLIAEYLNYTSGDIRYGHTVWFYTAYNERYGIPN